MKENSYNLSFGPVKAVLFTAASYLISNFAAILPFLFLLVVTGQDANSPLFESPLSKLVQMSITGAVAIYTVLFILKTYKNKPSDIGIVKFQNNALINTLLGFGAYFIILLTALTIVRTLFPSLVLDQEQQLGFGASDGALILFVSLVIIPAITEEILMRGLLYSGLRTKLNFWISTLITSLIFASLHLPAAENGLHWPAAIDTFSLSFVLCYLREKTGGLWAPVFLHMIKNTLALLFLLGIIQ